MVAEQVRSGQKLVLLPGGHSYFRISERLKCLQFGCFEDWYLFKLRVDFSGISSKFKVIVQSGTGLQLHVS